MNDDVVVAADSHGGDSLGDYGVQGFVPPIIYAFWTDLYDGLLGKSAQYWVKWGFTQRYYATRLKEWKNKGFFDIDKEGHFRFFSAMISHDTYIWDKSIHNFLMSIGCPHLDMDSITDGLTRKKTNEFYGSGELSDADDGNMFEKSVEVVENQMQKWCDEYARNGIVPSVRLHTLKPRREEKELKRSDKNWVLRPWQRDVVDSFVNMVARTKFRKALMFACPRFGKSFTALECARAVDSRLTVVLTAKTDVVDEWRKNVMVPANYEDCVFVSRDDSKKFINAHADTDYIHYYRDVEGKHVVVFMTLQDLYGSTKNGEAKAWHESLFKHGDEVDVLLCDETHYAFRAAKLGSTIGSSDDYVDADADDTVDVDAEDFINSLHLKPKYRIDLSGTPFEILHTDEFAPEQIIAHVEYEDLARIRDEWYDQNPDKPEYSNPLFGLPELRFVSFNVDDYTRDRMNALTDAGVEYGLGELFRADPDTLEFVHEDEVLDLLLSIDGSRSDSNIMGVLNDPAIIEGKLCSSIMTVLPTRAACDAFVKLINNNRDKFIRFCDYKILQISGTTIGDTYGGYSSASDVIETVEERAAKGEKTMIVTVNKMTTGVTIPPLDTILLMSETSSAQQYVQTYGRLLSSYVSDDGTINLKPQVLLVDMNLDHTCRMIVDSATSKSMISGKKGSDVRENVHDFLRFAPVIGLNLGRMKNFEPVEVMTRSLTQRTKIGDGRTIESMVNSLRINNGLLDNKDFLKAIGPVSRNNRSGSTLVMGVPITPKAGEDASDLDIPTVDTVDSDNTVNDDTNADSVGNDGSVGTADSDNSVDKVDDAVERVRSYCARIMRFVFLCGSPVYSLSDIIGVLNGDGMDSASDADNNGALSHAGSHDDSVIASHVGIDAGVCEWMLSLMDYASLRILDDAILTVRMKREDEELSCLGRMDAVFGDTPQFSDNEIGLPVGIAGHIVRGDDADYPVDDRTPEEIQCDVESRKQRIADIIMTPNEYIVDMSCNAAFSRALYGFATGNRESGGLGLPVDRVVDSLLCIPTSTCSYEIVRYVYDHIDDADDSISIPERNIARFTMDEMLPKGNTKKDKDRNIDIIKSAFEGHSCFSDVVLRDGNDVGMDSIHDDALDAGASDGAHVDGDGMKIMMAFGNPPYQGEPTGTDTHPPQIYPRFMDIAKEISVESIMITPGRFLKNIGSDWTNQLLNDAHYQIIKYYTKGAEVFPKHDIKGGLVISHYDSTSEYEPIRQFILDDILRAICNNVKTKGIISINKIMEQPTWLDLDAIYKDYPNHKVGANGSEKRIKSNYFERFPDLFFTEKPDDGEEYVKIFGLLKKNRCTRYVLRKYINKKSLDMVDNWNVIIPSSNGSGALGEVLSTPVIGTPVIGYSQTFIGIGPFKNQQESENCLKYLKSKFARVMLGTLKVTQSNSTRFWANVPLQDFTEASDIDWSKTIPEIDQQLYKKYGLNDEEIKYIEANVRPM